MRKILLFVFTIFMLTFYSCSKEHNVSVIEKKSATITWNEENINFAESSQWCLSRSNRWIAMTNYSQKTQYYIEWEGGMSEGIKRNPMFKISNNGNGPTNQNITTLELKSDGINCTLTFSGKNGESGFLTFPLSN